MITHEHHGSIIETKNIVRIILRVFYFKCILFLLHILFVQIILCAYNFVWVKKCAFYFKCVLF